MLRYYHDHLRPANNITNRYSDFTTTLPFYFHSAGNWMTGSDYYVRRDQRYDYYLLYTVSGTGFMNYKDENHKLTPGTVILIDCMEYHHYGAVKNWEHIWFHINGSGVKDFYRLINSPGVAPVMLKDNSRIKALYDTLEKNSPEQNLQTELENAHAIMDVLGYILEKKLSAESISPQSVPEWFLDLNDYIYRSRYEIITVFDLAKKYDIPVDKLERLYKLHSNNELAEVLRKQREDLTITQNTLCYNPSWLMETIVYIDNNFTTHITLDDLIKKHHVSRSTFMSKFKQYASMSPLQYIIKLRIEHSKALLKKSNNSISSVAYDCGFASSSDFSKKFREITGMTPKEFRKGV